MKLVLLLVSVIMFSGCTTSVVSECQRACCNGYNSKCLSNSEQDCFFSCLDKLSESVVDDVFLANESKEVILID